ncbi:MAG: hypothetical protein ACOYVD_08710 [Bacillota bacterium]
MDKKLVFCLCALLVLIFLLIPGTVFAAFDEYGYNETACIFNGSFENWENFVYGLPSAPVDWETKNVQFLVRKWSKDFDQAMFHGMPWKDGAWQMAHFYQYLSGEQEGWTWNWDFKIVFSAVPVAGAIDTGGNFWLIQSKTWLLGPQGEEIEVPDMYTLKAIPPSLGGGTYR